MNSAKWIGCGEIKHGTEWESGTKKLSNFENGLGSKLHMVKS